MHNLPDTRLLSSEARRQLTADLDRLEKPLLFRRYIRPKEAERYTTISTASDVFPGDAPAPKVEEDGKPVYIAWARKILIGRIETVAAAICEDSCIRIFQYDRPHGLYKGAMTLKNWMRFGDLDKLYAEAETDFGLDGEVSAYFTFHDRHLELAALYRLILDWPHELDTSADVIKEHRRAIDYLVGTGHDEVYAFIFFGEEDND